MKTLAIWSLGILIFSFNLTGQSGQDKRLFNNQKTDTILHLPPSNFPPFKDPNKSFNLPKQNFKIEVPEAKRYENYHIAERYPGSQRFYGNKSYAIYPYEKSFVKKPDSTVKYYLLIKDPLEYRKIK